MFGRCLILLTLQSPSDLNKGVSVKGRVLKLVFVADIADVPIEIPAGSCCGPKTWTARQPGGAAAPGHWHWVTVYTMIIRTTELEQSCHVQSCRVNVWTVFDFADFAVPI